MPSLFLRRSPPQLLPAAASHPQRRRGEDSLLLPRLQRPRRLGQPVGAFKEAAASSSSSKQQPPPQQRQPSSSSSSSASNIVPIPSSIRDVDNGRVLGFGADLAPDHPGFHDKEYKLRRAQLAELAKTHVAGTPPPLVDYSEEETKVWSRVFDEVSELYPRAACPEFLRALPDLGFTRQRIPQLRDVSATLERATGWQIRAVAGLMHPRDFLAGLAFRTFHSTQYLRHGSKPSYTPEPDVCHELLGHMPMLVNLNFTEMVRAIGVASLGADEARLWHLTKLYWFVVEFGVIAGSSGEGEERSSTSSSLSSPSSPSSSSTSTTSAFTPTTSTSIIPKAFGAGILSSFGEMEHLLSGQNYSVTPFDPFAPQPKMSYKDGVQKRYFSLESFEAGRELLLEYCAETTPLDVRSRFGLL